MRTLLAAVLLLGFAGAAPAADRTNLELFRLVSKQVNRYAYLTIFDSIHVQVDAGHVTLSGKVTMPYKALDLEKRVASIDGVKEVRNAISVLPVSLSDDRLRRGIARALYGHPVLAKYALNPNPSIHIIVERGRVTLDGVVDSDMDRTIASFVARSFPTFEVTNELKTSEEIEQQLEAL